MKKIRLLFLNIMIIILIFIIISLIGSIITTDDDIILIQPSKNIKNELVLCNNIPSYDMHIDEKLQKTFNNFIGSNGIYYNIDEQNDTIYKIEISKVNDHNMMVDIGSLSYESISHLVVETAWITSDSTAEIFLHNFSIKLYWLDKNTIVVTNHGTINGEYSGIIFNITNDKYDKNEDTIEKVTNKIKL